MKTQLKTWLFLGAVAYVLLSAFHGCKDAELEAEKHPAPPPATRQVAEPVEVRVQRPNTSTAPVQIGQGAAESLVMGQMAATLADVADQAGIPAASMHFPPLMADEPSSSGPFAERMAAALADGTLSSPLSMHMPPLFDDMAGDMAADDMAGDMAAAPEDDYAEADFAEAGQGAQAAHDPENPDIAALSAQLERQRRTIAALKHEIGVLRAAKEDLLDEVDRVQEQAAGLENDEEEADQTAQALSGPVEHEDDSGDRDTQNVQSVQSDELPAAEGGAVAALGQQEEDCGCDETPVVAPLENEAASKE